MHCCTLNLLVYKEETMSLKYFFYRQVSELLKEQVKKTVSCT